MEEIDLSSGSRCTEGLGMHAGSMQSPVFGASSSGPIPDVLQKLIISPLSGILVLKPSSWGMAHVSITGIHRREPPAAVCTNHCLSLRVQLTAIEKLPGATSVLIKNNRYIMLQF